MSYTCLILGESGSGKTCSLRNLDPKNTLLIQPTRKPLPFPSRGWAEIKGKGDGHNIFVSSDPAKIIAVMKASPFDVIIIDDWQYVLANMFMARRSEKGYDKFSDIAGAGFDLCQAAGQLSDGKRVYILAHTQTDDFGNVRIKTLGKMLDDKIVVEGLFTIVLRTHVENGKYYFRTQTDGRDTVKSPMGLFPDTLIDNDLAAVDARICDYYAITNQEESK
nr:MAG TPA: AAA domain protein [Caudoviricetes sp.]